MIFSVIPGTYGPVRTVRAMLTILLAVAWLPLTAHCQLEKLTELEVLRCGSMGTAAASGSSPCDDASCCGWEFGQYRLPQAQTPVSASYDAVVPLVLPRLDLDRCPELTAGAVAALPKPPRPWQFSLRAAPPPRAPSLVS